MLLAEEDDEEEELLEDSTERCLLRLFSCLCSLLLDLRSRSLSFDRSRSLERSRFDSSLCERSGGRCLTSSMFSFFSALLTRSFRSKYL